MQIVFEDGKIVETRDPIHELTDHMISRMYQDYIVTVSAYKNGNTRIFSEACLYMNGEYHWVRNWWTDYDTIRILNIVSVNDAGSAVWNLHKTGFSF